MKTNFSSAAINLILAFPPFRSNVVLPSTGVNDVKKRVFLSRNCVVSLCTWVSRFEWELCLHLEIQRSFYPSTKVAYMVYMYKYRNIQPASLLNEF